MEIWFNSTKEITTMLIMFIQLNVLYTRTQEQYSFLIHFEYRRLLKIHLTKNYHIKNPPTAVIL